MTTPGYRTLEPGDVARVIFNKRLEESVLRELDALAQTGSIDQRWLAVGRTHIEQGFMAVNRAVAQPRRLSDEDFAG